MSDTVWLAIIAGIVTIGSAFVVSERRKNGRAALATNGRKPVEKLADESYAGIIKAYREDEASRRAELLEFRLTVARFENDTKDYAARIDTLQDQVDRLTFENGELVKKVAEQKEEIARLWFLLGRPVKEVEAKVEAVSV